MKIEIIERGPDDFVVKINGEERCYFGNRQRAEGFVEGVEFMQEREAGH